jgi:HJR/Mrr/RecB family endonuclease
MLFLSFLHHATLNPENNLSLRLLAKTINLKFRALIYGINIYTIIHIIFSDAKRRRKNYMPKHKLIILYVIKSKVFSILFYIYYEH